MNKLYICRGLPASGKTFWARQFGVNHGFRACRVNRDDLRLMAHNGQFSTEREFFILRTTVAIIAQALMHGYDVVSDDTNLQTYIVRQLVTAAAVCGRPVEMVLFETPLALCIARDAKRAQSVGESVIRAMFESVEVLPPDLTSLPITTVYPGDTR